MTLIKTLMTATALLGLAVLPVRADSFAADQKKEIESIVRSYLLEHPEILREMSEALEAKDRIAEEAVRSKALKENAAAIFKSDTDGIVGNPNGDVTVVEFLDYNCGWCKKSLTEISALIEKDKNVRVVIKEFPIFGAGSEFAAKAAKAAARQGKYWDLHQALFKHDGPVTEEVTLQLAEGVGLDMEKLKADMQDEKIAASISATQALAAAMQFGGTPAFIVDDKVFPGYVPQDALSSAIGEVRSNGGCKVC